MLAEVAQTSFLATFQLRDPLVDMPQLFSQRLGGTAIPPGSKTIPKNAHKELASTNKRTHLFQIVTDFPQAHS